MLESRRAGRLSFPLSTLMSPRQIELVRDSFALLDVHSDIAALMFFQRLFTLDPSLHARLGRDIDELGEELIDTLREIVRNLERLAPRPTLNGTADEMETWRDETFHVALLWMLEHNLGPAFTPDVREAWTALLVVLADTLLLNFRACALKPKR
jgi:hemoglobin-like flavoprotein